MQHPPTPPHPPQEHTILTFNLVLCAQKLLQILEDFWIQLQNVDEGKFKVFLFCIKEHYFEILPVALEAVFHILASLYIQEIQFF